MKTIKLLALLIIASYTTATAQLKTGMIYGPNHVYSLTAPDGWVLDNTSGADQGIYAVFYKTGSNWANGDVVMYTNFVTVPENLSLEQFIKDDIEAFGNDTKATYVKDIKTDSTDVFKVYNFKYKAGNGMMHEYVGFVRCPTGVITIVMTTKEEKLLKKEQPAFESLVKSYWWLTDSIGIETQEGDSDD